MALGPLAALLRTNASGDQLQRILKRYSRRSTCKLFQYQQECLAGLASGSSVESSFCEDTLFDAVPTMTSTSACQGQPA